MKDSLRWLLDKFPYFLDKNTGSNFYKSSSVINDAFKLFRQDLFNTHMGHRLEKRVLLWKEQSSDYDYTMNFYVHLPYLKMVNLYKNGSLIYTESYEYDDEVDTFIYSYDDTSNTVIPSDKYHITVETYEEYVLSKGFPENDTLLGDMFDHDRSLDELGTLYDIPRKKYIYKESTNPENTEPRYNNRKSEDDYHYMNRILGYISHMQDTPLPVLEVWKLFGIPLDKISLINRERYLCKMYSSVKHGGDNWTPYDWEHKDPMGCFWPEPVFFFVEVDNHTPVLGQSVYFTFTFMNMFGEDKGKDYLIDVYLDGELIESGVDPTQVWEFSTKGVDDENPLVFQFIANPLNPRMEVLESDEIIITIKGCNSADWYVAVDGDDNNPGTKEEPFRTLPKALSVVEGSRNVIVLKKGTFYINNIQVIDTSTSIISCQGATIRNDNNYDFFRILQECNLYLMGITLKHKCCEMYGCDDSFYNFNYTQNPVYLRINPDFMCKPPVSIMVDNMTSPMYAHSNMSVDGTLVNANTDEPVPDEVIELLSNGTVVDTDTTDSNGEYGFTRRLNTLGVHSFVLNHEESRRYCMADTLIEILVEAMPTSLTAMMDSEVLLDDELVIAYDLTDYYGEEILDGSVQLYEDGVVVATVDAGEEFNYVPSTVGTHTYKLKYDCDETYITSESETFTVVVRRYHTSLFLECDTTRCTPSDLVTVKGTLSDERDNKLSGQTVKLYDGDTLIYTGTTNSNGEATYSHTFAVGKHTLQWRYEQSRKYDACVSNSYRIRVKDSSVDEINLYLYPDKRIGVTGTSIGLNVYATDENGSPISTGFKLVDTYNGVCGEYPATSYTTGSDGWWHGNFSTQAIVECHGTYIQAVSTVDTDIYSNTVHVFDVASPLLDTVSEIYSSLSYFDKDTVSVPVNVALYDEVDEPLPLEPFSVKLVSDGTVVSSTNGTTDVRGEADVNISIPASVRGDEITLRIVYTGRANAYNGSSDELTLPYMFSPVLTFSTGKQVYVEGESVTGSCIIKDEFNTVLSGKSIKLYDGATLLDTQVSDNTGNVSFSVSGLVTGQHTLHCEYTGTGLYHDAVSSNVNIMIKKITSLDISVPLVLVYSDEFKITGTLKDSGARGVSGKTVKLLVGSTVVDSLTTNNSGVVEFTRSPVHMGTHSFQLVFDGTSEYVESSSSVVTREIGKETSVLQVSSPVNDASIYVDESLSISGSLVTNDNEKISGASIVVSENGNTLKTLTTNSNGAFTGSLTGLSAGTHSLKFEFVSDTYYTGSTVTRNVIVNNHSYSISANVNRSALLVGDSVTISGVLKKDGVAWSGQTVTIKDGTTSKGTCTTNSNGAYTKTITGLTLGAHSLKAVHTNAESEVKTVNVYDDVVVATVTGNNITLGMDNTVEGWLSSTGDVVIDWGDGTQSTVNNPTTELSHTYNDGLSNHDITFIGEVTSLGYYCFSDCTGLTSISIPNSVLSIKQNCFEDCTSLTSVVIPDGVTNLGGRAFAYCSGLTSVMIPDSVTSIGYSCFVGCRSLTRVTIPNSVTSLGEGCFQYCGALVDYQLYWTGNNIITYNSDTMPNNTGTIYTIPQNETSNYTSKGYPTGKLVERGETLTLTCDKPIIQKTETSTVTATLKQAGSPLTGKTLNYQVKHGNTVISSGTKTTNSSGQATISYTGTGIGDVDVIVSYGSLLQEIFVVQDCHYWNDGSSVTGLEIDTGVSCTSNGDYITITTSTSGEKYVRIPVTLANTDNWIYEVEIADTVTGSTNQPIALNYDNASKWAGHSINGSQWFANSGVNDSYTQAYQVGDKLTIIRENGVDKAILNDNIIISNRTVSHNSTFKVGFYTNNGRTQKIKNIKLKAL